MSSSLSTIGEKVLRPLLGMPQSVSAYKEGHCHRIANYATALGRSVQCRAHQDRQSRRLTWPEGEQASSRSAKRPVPDEQVDQVGHLTSSVWRDVLVPGVLHCAVALTR